MSNVSTTTPVVTQKKRSRIGELIGVFVIIGIVVGAAFFQESISAFFSLKMWDKGAPSRTVEQFLAAGKKGDKAAAQALVGTKDLQELNTDGKWRGYFMVTQAGTLEFDFADLAPQGEAKASEPEFMTIGAGSAMVSAADSKGKEIRYQLKMVDGSWKITEIRGGRVPASKPAAPAPKSGGKIPGSK